MKTRHLAVLAAGIALAVPATAASSGKPSRERFLAERREILLLAVERTRTDPFNFQRALKRAEDRLRALHDDYKVKGSTPPTSLDGDVRQLKAETQKAHLARTRGRSVPGNPDAARLIEGFWSGYEARRQELYGELERLKAGGAGEGLIYWTLVKKYDELRAALETQVLFNPPPGRNSAEEAFLKDKLALLRALELTPRKTRRGGGCVTMAEQHPRDVEVDAKVFFHSQGMLPDATPAAAGAFAVPPGCRTVTRRQAAGRTVFRVSHGRGVAYLGSTEKDFQYGYIAVPPDVPHYFENVSEEPLLIEYVVLGSS